ncbi:MAG: glutamyl-tRNA reductase [Lysobacterales bacterium]
MPLIAIGISHNTASVEIREKVAIGRPQYADKVQQVLGLEGIEEVVILGTCNRTELYCVCASEAEHELLRWMHRAHGVPEGELNAYFYCHTGEDAVRHLMRVAGGLESLVLGEPQILGQMKEAWQVAQKAGGAGKVLDRLVQHTFAAAKSARTRSGIGSHTISVAFTAVTLARQIFGDLTRQNVVLLGAGEMIRLCGKHLLEQGIGSMEIVNRSLESAGTLAAELGVRIATLESLPEVLPRADILISSTASPRPLILRPAVKSALRKRRHRPMFMVDIAVPRDIEPSVGELDDVYLYTIDDLQQVVDENLQSRQTAAEAALVEIEAGVEQFMRWLYGIRAARSLKRIHAQSHAHELDLVEKALRRLQAGQDPEHVLLQLASTLTSRILHGPTERLREAAEEQEYEILKAADLLFKSKPAQEIE